MHYSNTANFEGETGRALDFAAASLGAIGFRTLVRDDSSLEMVGPGMNSTRQSSLVGASRLIVACDAHELSISADLGGVRFMKRFITFFPIGLLLTLGVVFFVVFSIVFDHRGWVDVVLWSLAPNAILWAILSPLLGRKVESRTRRALDALLNEIAIHGRVAQPYASSMVPR
jgi:hypothetical protein